MGGAIRISEIEGRLNGKTMGGEVRPSNIKGDLDLSTMGGEINLTNSEVDGTLSTMGGKVVFEDVIGNVKGSSMGGNVVYRNVRRLVSTRSSAQPDSVGEEVNISTMGGEIRVDDAPLGANVSTMGGDVNVGRVARFVKAKTMGGDIRIQAIDGWVEAETMGGNVSVSMIGAENGMRRSANISSKGGEITLTVPAGLSVQFDLEPAYTRNSNRTTQSRAIFHSRFGTLLIGIIPEDRPGNSFTARACPAAGSIGSASRRLTETLPSREAGKAWLPWQPRKCKEFVN